MPQYLLYPPQMQVSIIEDNQQYDKDRLTIARGLP